MESKDTICRVTAATSYQAIDFSALTQELQRKNPEGFSTSDMAAQVDKSDHWCRTQIKQLIKAGKLQFNGMAMRPRIDRRMAAVPIYSVVDNG